MSQEYIHHCHRPPDMSGHNHGQPFETGYLAVGEMHQIYFEQYGRKEGKPAIFLHGGPGGNSSKDSTKFFDAEVYRVVLFDHRGAGKSLPHAELRENTTQHLINDIEILRRHVGVQKWHTVFGGSWGSTLALAYAETYPAAVGSLVLRSIMLGTEEEMGRLHRGTISSAFFPQEYEEWLHYLPEEARQNPTAAYHALLTSEDPQTRLCAGRAWNLLELGLSQLVTPPDLPDKLKDEKWVLAHSRLEAHYTLNKCFLEDGQLLKDKNVAKIRHIPSMFVDATDAVNSD